ncbi:pickpocket protein 19-like [Schistocerca piceifrons]|uniref:pickpocket protein 19-like n=1 Tax=Schistocerca piceifrons TaxID=274613 RepID=UPI001F5FA335|nr:pickpocket protein 19-like [Schistocerca piceifrons]
MSLEVARRFGSRTTMTVVESTNHPVYEVAYPAVVVCDNNRVHWDKLLDYERRQLSELDADTRAVFRSLVTSLALMEWADFDLFTPKDLANYRALDTLSHVNFSDVMKQVMPKCEEFFHNACYWRSETRNCCDIFEVLLTDIGYCFAFNSLFNHMSRTHSRDGELLPRRVSSSGKWSGLRFDVNTSSLQPPGLSVQRGVVVSVNEPTALRMDGLIVGSDQMALVRVSSDVTYTTHTVRSLRPGDRGCLYSNERDTLQQGAYSYANCRLECFRQYAIATCACLPYFFPPAGNHNTCTTVQFKCLYDNNDMFNYIKPGSNNPYFDEGRAGMVCTCPAECDSQTYNAELYPSEHREVHALHASQVDVHFRQELVVRYRTDVVFDWFTLLVSFGGTAGLFLGASMLSAVELVYFLVFRTWLHVRAARAAHLRPALVPYWLP